MQASSDVVKNTESFVQKTLADAESGHGWWHIDRVRKNALKIARAEGANLFMTELGALLHDIADHKFNGGDHTIGSRITRTWLESQHVDSAVVDAVCEIVFNTSFRGLRADKEAVSLEAQCVQDADRLESSGAIGIARTMTYGANLKRPVFDPDGPPLTLDAPWNVDASTPSPSTIHHFYEKLLHLKDRMNTKTGRSMAEDRHRFVEIYIEQFLKEWNG